MRRTLFRCAAAALCFAAFAGAQGQTYPQKPVRIVVNIPPGGAADQIARPLAAALQEKLDQPFVDFYEAYAKYQSDAAAWDAKYAPPPVAPPLFGTPATATPMPAGPAAPVGPAPVGPVDPSAATTTAAGPAAPTG